MAIRYANQHAIRSQPISDRLANALSFLDDMGVEVEVFSGGQPAKGTSNRRRGTTRHDHGNAADVFFYKDGRKLSWSNPQDVPVFQEIVQKAKANGITGIGAGRGYMRDGSMHIGFGRPGIWGAGGKGSNAPGWLRTAWSGAPTQVAGPAVAALAPDQRAVITPPQRPDPIRAPLPPGYHPPSQPARPITPTPQLAPAPAQDPTAMRLDNTAMVGTDLLRDLLSPRKPAPVPAEGPLGGPVNRPGDRPLPPPSSPHPDPQPTREPPLAGLPRHMGVPTASMVEQARASVDTGSSPPGVPTPRSPIGGPQIAAQRPDRATAIDPQYGRGNIADNPAFPPQPRQNPNRAMAGIPDSNPSFRHPLPTYGVLPGANPIPAPPPSYGNAIASLAPSPGSAPSPAPGGGGLSSLASLFSGFGGGGQQQEAPPLMQAPLTPLAMLLPVPDPFRGYS